MYGPYETEADARLAPMPRELRQLRESAAWARAGDPGRLTCQVRLRHLTEACQQAGVQLGTLDRSVLAWLSRWEDTTVQVLIGLITRAHAAPNTATPETAERIVLPSRGQWRALVDAALGQGKLPLVVDDLTLLLQLASMTVTLIDELPADRRDRFHQQRARAVGVLSTFEDLTDGAHMAIQRNIGRLAATTLSLLPQDTNDTPDGGVSR